MQKQVDIFNDGSRTIEDLTQEIELLRKKRTSARNNEMMFSCYEKQLTARIARLNLVKRQIEQKRGVV